ncbi:MAG: hypothetical protein WC707_01340 [Candidatus Babeliaceae bacterium]|jgi:hypothetical protein
MDKLFKLFIIISCYQVSLWGIEKNSLVNIVPIPMIIEKNDVFNLTKNETCTYTPNGLLTQQGPADAVTCTNKTTGLTKTWKVKPMPERPTDPTKILGSILTPKKRFFIVVL